MKTKNMVLVSLFAALTAVGAFITIPLPFVPFTLQFLFCAFAGVLLGSKLGMASQLLYVLIGLSGVPVFTKGGGPSYVLQPSFGYLIGFIVGAYVIGWIVERYKRPTFKNLFLAVVSGLMVIYLLGVPYLYIIFNFYLDKAMSVNSAIFYGFTVFIGGDLVSSVIVVATAYKILPRLRQNNSIISSTLN